MSDDKKPITALVKAEEQREKWKYRARQQRNEARSAVNQFVDTAGALLMGYAASYVMNRSSTEDPLRPAIRRMMELKLEEDETSRYATEDAIVQVAEAVDQLAKVLGYNGPDSIELRLALVMAAVELDPKHRAERSKKP